MEIIPGFLIQSRSTLLSCQGREECMKKALILSVFLMVLSIFLPGCNQRQMQINNVTPFSELQTEQYNQEQFYTIQAIFYAQQPFHKVAAQYLCDYEDITLEFKRSTDQNDYYVLHHEETVKCFIFTDKEDNVREVLVMRDIPSIQETKEFIEKQKALGFSFPDHYYSSCLSLDITPIMEKKIRITQYFLSDGVLLEETRNPGEDTETTSYLFYTDEEWALIASECGGYAILPIDKT